jgi:glycosyltransferase involved in cell wall biosynthesis
MEAFQELSQQMSNVRLIVAGSDHPSTPGYIASVAETVAGNPGVEFTGYVAEEDISQLFRRSSVLVLPYSSATGASGVAHLACEFGVPIISADIKDFREMATDEDLAVSFYDTGSAASLASQLQSLLNNSEQMREMSEQNFSAALRMTMPQIIRQYLRSFDLHQRARALEPISRFRRIPAWVPSRSAIFRAAAPRWQSWT